MGRDPHAVKNHLRRHREARGWTQGELAARLGVSRQTINALEAGRWDPSLQLAFTIADAFDTTIESIFEPQRARARS